ncbi:MULTISPECIES: FkbM family methyltransferase [unclassified Methylobacterium]|jgi:FkbM family methyltransferase|uniref:FkbM family methyltransferase n=1 Tax=unclassified Methylobacterium TaxID=2615210 RepID=UPI0006FBC98B|nr:MULTISPECIES: FkbM family methyltransferase [unclassified Methylobacterium]KQO66116.1 FkbM family methyltransferase [Methylobacterium sp. Leaf89]KQO73250.1 FkbM family methyltransferase [Methylobacterium sp. Leaf88]KQP66245.1 FkbM family methyltransferase [Methylobacterium sp. Leaf111]KQU26319.1 FkbM family methyltransferase [Methylobacterium sp. Leaf94]
MKDTQPYGTYAPTGLVARIARQTGRISYASWAGRRLALFLRRVAIGLLRGAPLDVERYGARMRLYPYNNNCEKKVLFTPQFFDPEERALLRAKLQPGCTFLDIGANIGAYALFVAAFAGPRARILAVEPQPDVFDRLTYNIAQNPFGTVKAVACAVADKAGELTLFVDPRNRGESSLKIVGTNEGAQIRVPAVPLLDLALGEGIARIDAMKLDVEGAEDLILEPFLRAAPASLHPRLLIVENGTDQWQIDLPALLEQHGYRRIARTRLNLIFERAD